MARRTAAISPEMLEELKELAEVATQVAELDTRRRALAMAAVSNGVPKSLVAATAGITRPTLDRWLKEAAMEGSDPSGRGEGDVEG